MSAPEVTTKPVFLGNWACPFVQRAWAALDYKGVDYTYVEVDLQNKPEWFLSVSPLGKVPVITYRDEDDKTVVLHESLTLLEFIDEQYKGPSLLPASPAERARARIIINRFDLRVVGTWAKLNYQTKEEKDAETAKALGKELSDELNWVEGQLDGKGPYFLGANFSNVDAAIAPWLLRAHVLEGIRGFKVFAGRPRLQAYAATLRQTPAIVSTLQPPAGSGTWEEVLLARSLQRVPKHIFTF